MGSHHDHVRVVGLGETRDSLGRHPKSSRIPRRPHAGRLRFPDEPVESRLGASALPTQKLVVRGRRDAGTQGSDPDRHVRLTLLLLPPLQHIFGLGPLAFGEWFLLLALPPAMLSLEEGRKGLVRKGHAVRAEFRLHTRLESAQQVRHVCDAQVARLFD
jgi:hypothetical protein